MQFDAAEEKRSDKKERSEARHALEAEPALGSTAGGAPSRFRESGRQLPEPLERVAWKDHFIQGPLILLKSHVHASGFVSALRISGGIIEFN